MNQKQRDRLAKALEKIEDAADIINEIREEELSKFENTNIEKFEDDAATLETIQDGLADIKQEMFVIAQL